MAKIDFRKLDTYRKSFDGILQVKKHVNSEDDLPVTGAQNGDIYTVGDSDTLYMFSNGEWRTLGSDGGATVPMVVHGTTSQDEGGGLLRFVPNVGQPTFLEAVEAFESGIPVMLVLSSGGVSGASSNVLCHFSMNGTGYLAAYFIETFAAWVDSEPTDPEPDPGPDPIQ